MAKEQIQKNQIIAAARKKTEELTNLYDNFANMSETSAERYRYWQDPNSSNVNNDTRDDNMFAVIENMDIESRTIPNIIKNIISFHLKNN